MNAQIITIGDEIIIGQTLNTNAAFIGEKLSRISVYINKTSVVGDTEERILDEFELAFNNNDIVIVTGGLGPTHDDITLKCITAFFDTELIENEDVLDDITERFKRHNHEITPTNKAQALVPKISQVIRNPLGTAPGHYIEKDGKIFVSLPGVPYEMEAMITDYVIPRIKEVNEDGGGRVMFTKNLLTTGIPESILYERLGNIKEIIGDTKLAFLPNQYGVKMRITASSDSEEEALNSIIEVEQKIRGLAGRYIYGKDNDTLEDAVAKLMIDRGLIIAIAESCTGGLVGSRLTNVSGSSAYFERGVVTYSNAAKVELLRVDEDLIVDKGAVSLEVCLQMAEGIRAISGSDIGLATTGIMGPTGGTFNKPVGTVFIGICDEKVCTAREYTFGENRLLNKDRTSQAALEMLRRYMLGIDYDE